MEISNSKTTSPLPAVILAGGLGTRIKHLLEGLPKPLAPVAGKPFLEWIIRFLMKQNIKDFIISAGYHADIIDSFCENLSIPGINITCVAEPKPMGTGGGFVYAVEKTSHRYDGWIVCNGDSLICADLNCLLSLIQDTKIDGAILGLKKDDSKRYGSLICDEQSNLLSFQEKTSESNLINSGIYFLRRNLLKEFPQKIPLSFETDVFPTLINSKIQIKVPRVSAPFLDIGTEESLKQAETFILQNKEFFI